MADSKENILEGAPKLAPFNPSSDEVIDNFLKLANVTKDDVVYDLGCGDGRVLIETFRRVGCRCVGVDYDKEYIGRATEELSKYPEAQSKVKFLHQDILETDLTECTVLFMYLSVTTNEAFNRKILEAYERGIRIVSNMFSAKGISDEPAATFKYSNGLLTLRLYHKPGPESSPLIALLDRMLDPLENPLIMIVVNAAMLCLLLALGWVYVNDIVPAIHVYILSFLTIGLLVSINMVFSLLGEAKATKESKKDC